MTGALSRTDSYFFFTLIISLAKPKLVLSCEHEVLENLRQFYQLRELIILALNIGCIYWKGDEELGYPFAYKDRPACRLPTLQILSTVLL